MKIKYSLLFTICFTIVSSLHAQSIEVLKERELNLGLDGKILVENHLTVNPKDSTHLFLSGMFVDSKNPSHYGNYAIQSLDKGNSWKHLKLFDIPEGADPWGLITKKGTLLATVLGLNNLFLFRSDNGGKKWNELPIDLGKAHDHQTMIEDRLRNRIYIVSIQGNSLYVNYSLDDGKTFNNVNRFVFSNLSSNTMTPALLSDGTLMVSFTTFNRPAINGTRNGGKAERLQQNLSWTIPYTVEKGFGTPLFLSEACETGFPVLANNLDATLYNDYLYYVCSSQTEKSIIFHYSNTKGESWTAGKLISTFTNSKKSKRNPFTGMPQVTVNNKGVVGVIWQDKTEDSSSKCQYLYFAASLDGGKSFMTPVKVSSKQSCMERKENNWAGKRYKSGGDYTGFISDRNGNFIVIWPDSRNGISKLYSAKIKVNY